jgi:hypothetical protein
MLEWWPEMRTVRTGMAIDTGNDALLPCRHEAHMVSTDAHVLSHPAFDPSGPLHAARRHTARLNPAPAGGALAGNLLYIPTRRRAVA